MFFKKKNLCYHKLTLAAECTKKLGSFFLPFVLFLVCPLFFTIFTLLHPIRNHFLLYCCALSCILQSQLFCTFRTQFLSSVLLLLYSQGLFFFTIAQIVQHFQHSFPLWNCRWWLFVYCCIFNAILIILQLFLFDSCVVLFSKFLLFYKDLCVCLFVHVFLSMMKL